MANNGNQKNSDKKIVDPNITNKKIYLLHNNIVKGSLGPMVKLSPCDLDVTGLSRGNSILQLQGKCTLVV